MNDDMARELRAVREAMKGEAAARIQAIPKWLDFLDQLQNSQYMEAAEEVTESILSLGDSIIPSLKLKERDPNFIHYFSYYVVPRCNKRLLEAMRAELWDVMERNDLTEYTDIAIIQSLRSKGLYGSELKELLHKKIIDVSRNERNITLVHDYMRKAAAILHGD